MSLQFYHQVIFHSSAKVVPELCYPKLAQKLCVGVCVGGA